MKVWLDNGKVKTSRDARYNSAYLVANGAVQPVRYDKVRLTPFGETMPFISRWPWLQNQLLAFGAGGMRFDLAAGQDLTVIPVPIHDGRTIRLVTPICFESTVNGFCRELVFEKGQRRADLIANLTNDGWFGNSDIAREQHLGIARWRCVELATPMARAANTGISAIVDSKGRILSRGVEGSQQASRNDGILRGPVTLSTATTMFARVGNIFPWTVLGLTTAALAASLVRKWLPGRFKVQQHGQA
jgi:apolipoprotein N-acyltransferase